MFLRSVSSSYILLLQTVPRHKLNTRYVLPTLCEIRRKTPVSGFRTSCAAVSVSLYEEEPFHEKETDSVESRGIRPNHQTFTWLLEGCLKRNGSLDEGRKLHGQILKLGFDSNASLSEKLLDLYLKGDLNGAWKVFDEMPERTVFAWNKMIKELASRNLSGKALGLVSRMVNENVTPDEGTFAGIFETCRVGNVAFDIVEQIHARMIYQGLGNSTVVCNPLIDLCSRNGFVDLARKVFDGLRMKDHSSWVAMISGLSKNECEEDAIRLFCDMYILDLRGLSTILEQRHRTIKDRQEQWRTQLDFYVTPHLPYWIRHWSRRSFGPLSSRNNLPSQRTTPPRLREEEGTFRSIGDGLFRRLGISVDIPCSGDIYFDVRVVHKRYFMSLFETLRNGVAVGRRLSFVGITRTRSELRREENKGGEEEEEHSSEIELRPCGEELSFLRKHQMQQLNSGRFNWSVAAISRELGRNKPMFLRSVSSSYILLLQTVPRHKLNTRYVLRTLCEIRRKTPVSGFRTSCAAVSVSLYEEEPFHEKETDSVESRGIRPNHQTFTWLLEGCLKRNGSLDEGRKLHGQILKLGFDNNASLSEKLLDLNGFVDLARKVFDGLRMKDHSSWVAMISGLSKNECEEDAIRLFCDMYILGIMPTPYALSSVLSACKKIQSFETGLQLHGLVLKLGFASDTYVCNALVSLYFHLGNLISAEHIFSNMSHRDAVTYNTLINGLSQCCYGEKAIELFKRMKLDGLEPDCNTLASLVIACSADESLSGGQQLHAYTTKLGFASDEKIEGALLNLYAKCSDIETALDYFLETEVENVVLWNVMLVAYGLLDDLRNSFRIFRQMQMEEIVPNQYTYPSILKTCIRLGDLELGEQIHCQIVKTSFQLNAYVCSVLIDMYSKLGKLDTARDILVRFAGKDVVSWTTMIAGYTQYNFNDKALATFRQMLDLGIRSDEVGFTNAISACAGLQSLKEGQQIHAQSCVSGFSFDLPLQNALVTLYSRCGKVEEAYLAFEQTEAGDNIAWNALVSGFQQSGNNEEALRVFARMKREGINSNNFTFGSAVKAASETANMKQGKQVHAVITKTGYDSETEVCNALISMYAKCGSISDAKKQFLEASTRNEVSWNAIINAYSKHGFGSEALDVFDQMIRSNVRPNHVTFVGVLSACSHIGLVEKGIEYFESMNTKYGLAPKPEHYVCVVDMLTRAGLLTRAKEFIEEMPIDPDALVWRTLLSACVVHKNLEIGEFAARHLVELEPEDSATYVLLSNLYAVCKKWDARDQTRQKMKEKGVKKEPGQSWIEVRNTIHPFYVGDQKHPLADEIHEYFRDLTRRASEIGYVQDCFSLLNEAQQEAKDPAIFIHSEKLAISYGLLSLPSTMPVNVMKNLRVCNDCHDWIKFVSKVSNREIIVRDAYRFHHFEGGACSCKDYW
ncbi:hypothetical protein F2Q68_00026618 [Brassica cretica]|uniref:DYW domain-containing protein n=1 Tax=Brassica cretica TaxID=69181 RepID=A0A8S9I8A7_BRACR|nr:hypothetical protein F2Q68_00026618 [Brassica cretica]